MLGDAASAVQLAEFVAVQPAVLRVFVVPVERDTALIGQAGGTASIDGPCTHHEDTLHRVTVVVRRPRRSTDTSARRCRR